MITTICASCGQEQTFADYLAGMKVHCKKCPGWIHVPARGAESPLAQDAVSGSGLPDSADQKPPQAVELPETSFEPDVLDEFFCPLCGAVNSKPKGSPQAPDCTACGGQIQKPPSVPSRSQGSSKPDSIRIPFSPLRCMLFVSPFFALILIYVAWDVQKALPNLPVVLRNFGAFVLCIGLLSLIGYYRMYLVVDSRGLTIQYPIRRRTYDWLQIDAFQIELQRFLYIPVPMLDVIHFSVRGQGLKFVASLYAMPTTELTALFQQRQHAARYPADLVQAAEDEAVALSHDYVGSEHLLLAIAGQPLTPAARALATCGITRVGLSNLISRVVESNPTGVHPPLRVADSFNQTLEIAVDGACELQHERVEAEHVLLAILAQLDTLAVRTIEESGADLDNLRDAVVREAGWNERKNLMTEHAAPERKSLPWLVGTACAGLSTALACLFCWWLASNWSSFSNWLLIVAGVLPGFAFLGGYALIAKRYRKWPTDVQLTRIGIGAACAITFALATYLSFVTVSHTWSKEQLPPEKRSFMHLILNPDDVPDLRTVTPGARRTWSKNSSWHTITIIAFCLGGFAGYRISGYGSL